MLPESLLKFSTSQGHVVPHYLDERDHPWIGHLWEEYLAFVGRPKAELRERLASQLPFSAPAGKRSMVSHFLNGIFRTEVKSRIPPREVRTRLFVSAAHSSLLRKKILDQVAGEFSVRTEEIESALYADLPNQRCLMPATQYLAPVELALRTNLMLVQGILARARSVEIRMSGNSGAVVRHAKRKGLLCSVSAGEETKYVRLSLSGPYSIFRRTLLYGRALGELVPVLAWCNEFEMSAQIIRGDNSLELKVRSGDPILPSEPPKPFDSKLEERFYRTFRKATRSWDIIREPEPVHAAGTLIFPDFALQHRSNPDRRWLLEIVGYWTPDYLQKKMERLRATSIRNMLLCVNEGLNCADSDFPKNVAVIRFAKNLSAEEVLERIGRD